MRPSGPFSSTRPIKLADALPLPVRFTVKMGGASDGLVTGTLQIPVHHESEAERNLHDRLAELGERHRGRGDRSRAEPHEHPRVGDAFDDSADGSALEPRWAERRPEIHDRRGHKDVIKTHGVH